MYIEYLLCTDHSSNVNNFMEAFEEKSVCVSNICYVLIIHQMKIILWKRLKKNQYVYRIFVMY
jgi:hypothetical protein